MAQQSPYSTLHAYPSPGEVLDGKYRIDRLLGEGGMGAVARATHLVRKAPVALKFMSPAVLALYGAVERFVNEGVAASQIDSDHVVKVFDVGRLPSGAPYLVMEFLDGVDLGQLLDQVGRMDVPRAVHFALQILRALQTAHAAGIIHRDMKPSNCFVIEKDGEPDFVKLVDFGISKVRSEEPSQAQANLTRTNSALGTPLYMSPEQARSPRDVDQRADLYSVGAILYQLLTGYTPYSADSGEYTEILFKIFTTDPVPLQQIRPDLPEGLSAVIHRALAKDKNARFATALDMAEALAPFADDRSQLVLTRLRGARSRSVLPPPVTPSPSIVPPAPVHSPAASANTYLDSEGGATGPRAPGVPSVVGVTREARPTSPGPSRGAFVAAGVALVLVVAGGSLALLLRPGFHAEHEPLPPVPAPASAALAAPSMAPLPPAAPAAQPEPAPSSASAQSAAPAATPPAPQTSGTTKPTPGRPPSTLGGIQLH